MDIWRGFYWLNDRLGMCDYAGLEAFIIQVGKAHGVTNAVDRTSVATPIASE
ncbi:MAG: hypothetical protein OXS47_02525 [Chloroflexota bacterium]|nr:hypothetical protein [Chloroflexota bacterium]